MATDPLWNDPAVRPEVVALGVSVGAFCLGVGALFYTSPVASWCAFGVLASSAGFSTGHWFARVRPERSDADS